MAEVELYDVRVTGPDGKEFSVRGAVTVPEGGEVTGITRTTGGLLVELAAMAAVMPEAYYPCALQSENSDENQLWPPELLFYYPGDPDGDITEPGFYCAGILDELLPDFDRDEMVSLEQALAEIAIIEAKAHGDAALERAGHERRGAQ